MIAPQRESPLQKKLNDINREAEERDAARRAERAGDKYVDLRKTPISIDAVKLIGEKEAKDALAAAVEVKTKEIALAAYDPHAPQVAALIEGLKAKGYSVHSFVVSKSGLEQAWYFYKFISGENTHITGKVEIEKEEFSKLLSRLGSLDDVHKELAKVEQGALNTTELLEIFLAGGLTCGASDVHFEAEEKKARARFRLDGILHDVYDLPHKNYDSLVSRIKLLSGLKINIHGEPQDGRFTINFPSKEVEMRVSIIPSEFGETIVMRILDPDAINVSLDVLGLREDDLSIVRRSLAKPNGLILNTGPTGSGKTTTLYAFLKELSNPEIKIITVEDPIEYRIKGVEQTQVNNEVGYTFANGLRAILRQDPDVILIGEIRDHETADISLQASLTGHLVLSTLHTNNAPGAVPRLIDLDIRPQTIGPALSLVIAQRLVRKLCLKCRKKKEIPKDLEAALLKFVESLPPRVEKEKFKKPELYEAAGCAACNSLGYKGRVGVYEFFEMGPDFEEVLLGNSSAHALEAYAERQGMVSMQADGILKVIQGVTSFEEVKGVTGELPWEKK